MLAGLAGWGMQIVLLVVQLWGRSRFVRVGGMLFSCRVVTALLQDERILMAFQATSVPPAAASGAQHVTGGGSTLRQQGRSSKVRWRSAAAGAAPPPSAGVDALTAGVRQLSFTPGAPAAAAAGAPSAAGESGSTAGTRRGGRPRGRGFGSPVQ